MERELWSSLYRLARACDPAAWWELNRFFRLSDRRRVAVGRVA